MNAETNAEMNNDPASAPQQAGRTLVGRVVSNQRAKTLAVLVERRVRHSEFGKIIMRRKKFHSHYESGQYALGDVVEIIETRPISKTKSWCVKRLVSKAQ